MRLLNTSTLELKVFLDEQALQDEGYAILSHRWEEDEVTFEDMRNGNMEGMKGFRKMQGCCKVAKSEGFNWVWIDTCCIDKSSSAELSEAINSMFRWYQNAAVCYAYLSDLSDVYSGAIDLLPRLTRSAWFTRGWTLQELLAPQEVVFFSRSWAEIGTKHSLRADIARITRIHEDALTMRKSLSSFTVAQRMSWAARRVTSRIEDQAYCLMGLFDVNMPLLYGEQMKAFERLQHEILKNTEDFSILAWPNRTKHSAGRDAPFSTMSSQPLASSPSDFHPDICAKISSEGHMQRNNGRQRRGLEIPAELTATEWEWVKGNTFEISGQLLKVRGRVAFGHLGSIPRHNVRADRKMGVPLKYPPGSNMDILLGQATELFNYYFFDSIISKQTLRFQNISVTDVGLLLIPYCRVENLAVGVLVKENRGSAGSWYRSDPGVVFFDEEAITRLDFRSSTLSIRLDNEATDPQALANVLTLPTFVFRGVPETCSGYAVHLLDGRGTLRDLNAGEDLPYGWSCDSHLDAPRLTYRGKLAIGAASLQRMVFIHASENSSSNPPFLLAFSFRKVGIASDLSSHHPVSIGCSALEKDQKSQWPEPPLQSAPWIFAVPQGSAKISITVTVRRGPRLRYSVAVMVTPVAAIPP
jgi:hypothetical protein